MWEIRRDLEDFAAAPGIAEKFISGELGNNLLFVHKTLAVTHYIDELAQLAQDIVLHF